ncbi:MAG TPA: SDR family NAD(P)-dependent oxidoreductase, partial [Hyphomicrobiales bacterium]|nr:SDR family NAD(P)-dependent oxidoreductase [Hyphomicrobiales bacterium]
SVKSQIGHTKGAAGVAGVIKVVKAMHHRVLPPTSHIVSPNPGYRPASSPFVLRSVAEPWLGGRTRGAVSAYGFGGTNFHAVLAAYEPHRAGFGADALPTELFAFRGATFEDAARVLRQVAEYVRTATSSMGTPTSSTGTATSPALLAGLAYAAWNAGEGSVQCAFVASSLAELADRLALAVPRAEAAEIFYRPATPAGKVAWLYPGQGSQYPGMLRDLFVYFPTLRALLEQHPDCAAAIFPAAAYDEAGRREQRRRLTDTAMSQPALSIIESALSNWLTTLGLRPAMAAGHSLGEFAALSAAGAIAPPDLLALARGRARAILAAVPPEDPGAMAAVAADAATVRELLGDFPTIVAANHNSPTQTVISGPTTEVGRAQEHLKALGVMAKRIDTACAFHSPIVASAETEVAHQLAAIPMVPPQWPVYSNVTATRHGAQPDAILATLIRHLASPVRFVEMIQAMHADGARTFVEVGPRRVLCGLVRQILPDPSCRLIGLDGGDRGLAGTLSAVAQLAVLTDGFDAAPLFAGRTAPAILAEPPVLPPAAWLVNGARARPQGARNEEANPRARLAQGPVAQFSRAAPSSNDGWDSHLAEGSCSGGNIHSHGRDIHRDVDDHVGAPPAAAAEAVLQYLANMREMIRAQRDVLVSYYGGVSPASEPRPVTGGAPLAMAPRQDDTRRAAPLSASVTGIAAVPSVHATVPPVATVAPTVTTQASSPSNTVDHRALLFAIVSERTGYPTELLDPDLDLEADLSIDSIKRQEIIAELSHRLALREIAGHGIDELIEELAARKTLRSLLDWLAEHLPEISGNSGGQGDVPRASGAVIQTGGEQRNDGLEAAPASGAKPIAEVLLEIVSETTGYPAEVLDPDLDLEADLSIDSIKRLEIVGRLAGHPAVEKAGAGRDALLEQLSTLKTLRAIADWLEPAEMAPPRDGGAATPGMGHPHEPLARYLVQAVSTPVPEAEGDMTGTVFVITDDGRGIAGLLAERLRGRNASVRVVDFGADAAIDGVDGLIHLWPLHPRSEAGDVKRLFPLAQRLLVGGGRYLVTVGSIIGPDGGEPKGLGLMGLAQAAAAEFPCCRACHLELDPQATAAELAVQIEQELAGAKDERAVIRRDGERRVRRLCTAPAPRTGTAGPPLGRDSVVLFTGGARGVSAHLAVELARRYQCHLEITGRSPEPPAEEAADTRGITDPRLLRQALLAGAAVTNPGEVERLVRKTLAEREIRDTLAAIRAAGGTVRYTQLDVRDESALAGHIAACYASLGRIDGVVHGAGVVEPALIPAKSAESFARVFDTKVNAALTLFRHIRADVSFVVFFSSIASVATRSGQVDYGAANSVLDRLAAAWQARIAGRVLSVNWGPWAGTGMVGDALARSYAARGIGLIPLDEGIAALLNELSVRAGDTHIGTMETGDSHTGLLDELGAKAGDTHKGAGNAQVALICAALELLATARGRSQEVIESMDLT